MKRYPKYCIFSQALDEWESLESYWYILSVDGFASDVEEYVNQRMQEDKIDDFKEYCDKFNPTHQEIVAMEIELQKIIYKYIEEFADKVKCVKEPTDGILSRAISVWQDLEGKGYIDDAYTFAYEAEEYAKKRMEEENINYVKHFYTYDPPLADVLAVSAAITKDIDRYIQEYVDEKITTKKEG